MKTPVPLHNKLLKNNYQAYTNNYHMKIFFSQWDLGILLII